jgi:uncharacterized protein YjdB
MALLLLGFSSCNLLPQLGGSSTVTGISLDRTNFRLVPGASSRLVATVTPSSAANKLIEWSSDSANATVSPSGLVTAVALGPALITAKTLDGGFTASCAVTVAPVPVTGIALSKASVSVWEGGPAQLEAAISPADASDKAVTWSVSNAHAAVSQSGLVSAVSLGSAIVTATSADGSFTASCAVQVIPVPVSRVSLNVSSVTIAAGRAYTLTATVYPANAANKAVSWSSSDEDIAFVTEGETAGISVGQATVTVTSADGGFTASCLVTVAGSLPHTYSEVLPAATAFQNGINAAIACNDPAATAYAEYQATPEKLLTCYLSGYANSGYTLTGTIVIDVLPDFTVGPMNGSVSYSGGIVSEISCNEAAFNVPRSGSLSVTFTDGASGTLDLATRIFTPN